MRSTYGRLYAGAFGMLPLAMSAADYALLVGLLALVATGVLVVGVVVLRRIGESDPEDE